MSTTEKLLYLLENSTSHISGEQIANKLGLSRNAVWKAINALRNEGYIIDAVTNKGYTLSDKNTRFSKAGIEKYLRYPLVLQIYETLNSTNDIAKQVAINGGLHGTVIIAREQTNGKGRLGRQFFSPKGGLYMSVILRPDISLSATTLITVAAAVAVSRAVDKICGVNTGIKWVNDIFLDGKKICGILTSGSIDIESNRLDYAVLGIGVNIYSHPNGFPDEIKNIAGGIYKSECNFDTQNKLIAEILNEFFDIYENLSSALFLSEYRERSIIIGKEVICVSGDGEFPVTVKDIDDNAHLIVQKNDGETLTLTAGEVKIKI